MSILAQVGLKPAELGGPGSSIVITVRGQQAGMLYIYNAASDSFGGAVDVSDALAGVPEDQWPAAVGVRAQSAMRTEIPLSSVPSLTVYLQARESEGGKWVDKRIPVIPSH